MKRATRKDVTVLAGLTFVGLIAVAAVVWRSLALADAEPSITHAGRGVDKPTEVMSMRATRPLPVSDGSSAPAIRARSADRIPASMKQPLPPDGTPWRQVVAALMDRAHAGDKAASDRLYDDTFGCIQYAIVLGSARERLRIKSDVSEMSVGQIIRELASYDTMQSILRKYDASCTGVSRDELYEQMYPILRAAAHNGNEKAAACYVSGPYAPPGGGVEKNETSLAQWADDTLDFMHAGVRSGDWKMVIRMRMYFDPATRIFATSYNDMWQAHQFKPDPLVAYQYAALRAMGARIDGDEPAQNRTSNLLSGYRERYHLSDAQIRDAEQWAQQTYQQYFAGRPWLGANEANWCEHGD